MTGAGAANSGGIELSTTIENWQHSSFCTQAHRGLNFGGPSGKGCVFLWDYWNLHLLPKNVDACDVKGCDDELPSRGRLFRVAAPHVW